MLLTTFKCLPTILVLFSYLLCLPGTRVLFHPLEFNPFPLTNLLTLGYDVLFNSCSHVMIDSQANQVIWIKRDVGLMFELISLPLETT